MVLEKTLESPLDCRVIKSVNLKGNYNQYSLEGLMLEAEAPILLPPEAKT